MKRVAQGLISYFMIYLSTGNYTLEYLLPFYLYGNLMRCLRELPILPLEGTFSVFCLSSSFILDVLLLDDFYKLHQVAYPQVLYCHRIYGASWGQKWKPKQKHTLELISCIEETFVLTHFQGQFLLLF